MSHFHIESGRGSAWLGKKRYVVDCGREKKRDYALSGASYFHVTWVSKASHGGSLPSAAEGPGALL